MCVLRAGSNVDLHEIASNFISTNDSQLTTLNTAEVFHNNYIIGLGSGYKSYAKAALSYSINE